MTHMDILEELKRHPYEYARKYKSERGRPIVGYFCSYTPEELIFAADALPFRLFGTGEHIRLADTHLQAYCCSLVKGALEDAMAGRLDFLNGVVFPHTCDTIQRLSDIWRLNLPRGFHMDVVLPVKLNAPSSRSYMIDVLMEFRKNLEDAFRKKITDKALLDSIKTYNRIRLLLQKIHNLKYENPGVIAGEDLHSIMMASMIMDRSELIDVLDKIAGDLESGKNTSPPPPGERIVLSGGSCNLLDIYGIVEEAGAAVVGDDFCTGSRYYEGLLNIDMNPVEAIAERYLTRIVCPAKHSGLSTRADNIISVVREKKAGGVVFVLLKFCDPHAFDYPSLKRALDQEGIPSTLIEIEDQSSADGRVKTRLEAFIEMLKRKDRKEGEFSGAGK
jgi:bzd-type benzoyl-CoA reductase N subunit